MKYKIILIFFIISGFIFADNIMSIPDVSGNFQDTISVSINIANTDSIVAFQTDIILPDEATYLANSAFLTSRADTSHVLSVSLLEGDILRILVYSLSNDFIQGSDGSVVEFEIVSGTNPGVYDLNLSNSSISDENYVDVLTGTQNGSVTIWGPDIHVSETELDFGDVALESYQDRTAHIINQGTTDLTVSRIYTDDVLFEIIGDTTIVISASQNIPVTIRFTPLVRGDFQAILYIESDDPDEVMKSVNLTASAYGINELHAENASGRSGYPVELPFSINNMEEFVAFQFDLILPGVLSYPVNDIELTSRKADDHVVSANMIDENKLRVIAYSPSNQPFSGNSGDIVNIGLSVFGNDGNYSLNLTNVVISDSNYIDIFSASYNGTLSIISPDISSSLQLNMGEVSVLDTLTSEYQISNVGADTLYIDSFSSNKDYFWCDVTLPLTVLPSDNETLNINFFNPLKGEYSGTFTIRSNDPDEDPFLLNVSAESFAPNYLSIIDTFATANSNVTISLNVDNHEEFVAFQVDIELPDTLEYITGSANLTDRKQDHVIAANMINDNILRVFAYSMTQSPFNGNSGTIAELDFYVNMDSGNYSIIINDAILSDSNSENIIRDAFSGSIHVIQKPENLTILIDAGIVTITWDSIPEVSSYSVYSSEDPYSNFESWDLEQEGILTNTWNQPISNEKKFYYVKAHY